MIQPLQEHPVSKRTTRNGGQQRRSAQVVQVLQVFFLPPRVSPICTRPDRGRNETTVGPVFQIGETPQHIIVELHLILTLAE